MNTLSLLLYFATVLVAPAQILELFSSGFNNGGQIPDGSVNPWSDTRTLSGIADQALTSVSVQLSISGGFNGDLYGYLSHNGVLVPLLNRVGVGTGNVFGYADSRLQVILTDRAQNNIHFYQSVSGFSITGEAPWQPDGRMINPLTSAPWAFDTPGTRTLGAFSGMNPNGDWTLVLADLAAGGGQATVMSWGLNIPAVPEPVSIGLATAAALALFGLVRPQRGRRRTIEGAGRQSDQREAPQS